ncbi:MAG: hypothetical protein AB1813_19385 [Verrucomicrobiota bacterium]
MKRMTWVILAAAGMAGSNLSGTPPESKIKITDWVTSQFQPAVASRKCLRATPQVPPGVYRSIPYSALVIVPKPHPDEVAVVCPGEIEPRMPMLIPELKLIPRKRGR